MKLKAKIINPKLLDSPSDIQTYLIEQLMDFEDYQVKFITQHNNIYTVFYSMETKKVDNNNLLYNTRFEKLNNQGTHIHKSDSDLFDACVTGKDIQFTKTTDLFKSPPYTGPLNLDEFHKKNKDVPITMSYEGKRIKAVNINGKPVNFHINVDGNIVIDQSHIKIIKDDMDFKQDNMLD